MVNQSVCVLGGVAGRRLAGEEGVEGVAGGFSVLFHHARPPGEGDEGVFRHHLRQVSLTAEQVMQFFKLRGTTNALRE